MCASPLFSFLRAIMPSPTSATIRTTMSTRARRRGLLSREDEQKLATALRRELASLWFNLLSYPPIAIAVLDLLEDQANAAEKSKRSKTLQLDCAPLHAMRLASEKHRLRPHKGTIKILRAATLTAAEAAVGFDRCADIADLVRKEISEPKPFGFVPRKGSAVFREYMHSVEMSYQRYLFYRNTFIEKNYGLVMSIVKRYRMSQVSQEDLMQEAIFGLTKAVGRFDPERGFKFSTYASWWIRHAVTRHIHNKARMVRIPVHLISKLDRYIAAKGKLAEQGERATNDRIAEVAELPLKMVNQLNNYSLERYYSADAKNHLGLTILDRVADDFDFEGKLETGKDFEFATSLLMTLTPRERDIISARFGLNGRNEETLQKIGERHGLSRERIRQLEASVLESLRSKFTQQNGPTIRARVA